MDESCRLSPKKRFEKIEMDNSNSDKKSFFDRWTFKRKLEIKGSLRERISPHNFKGVRLDPKSMAGEIEIAEQKIQKNKNQQMNPKKNSNKIEPQLTNKPDRTLSHQNSTVFFYRIVALLGVLALIFQLNKNLGSNGFKLTDIFYILFLIILIYLSGRKIL